MDDVDKTVIAVIQFSVDLHGTLYENYTIACVNKFSCYCNSEMALQHSTL